MKNADNFLDNYRGRAIRNWTPGGSVWLNPDHPPKTVAEPLPLAA